MINHEDGISVVLGREELLAIVEENRAAHQSIFDEAVDGYRKEAVKQLENHIENIKSGKMIQIAVHLPSPVNHLKDYERVLRMLSMHKEETIELSETSFGMYVMDDWAWKRQFLTSNSGYSQTANRNLNALSG